MANILLSRENNNVVCLWIIIKEGKYANLGWGYFESFGVKSLGLQRPEAHIIFKNVSARLIDATRD